MSDATPGRWEAVHVQTISTAPGWLLPVLILAALVATYWLVKIAENRS